MRLLLALILLLAVGGIAFLLLEGDGPGKGNRQHERSTAGERDHPRIDPGATRVKPLPDIRGKQSQEDLAAFVAECRRRGEEVVPLLSELLRDGKDYKLQPRWSFRKRELIGYPTVRSAYLVALRGIPGEAANLALREALRDTRMWQEAYLIAIGLKQRGVEDWTGDLLDRAVVSARPANLNLQQDIIALAAESDPDMLAQRLVRDIPRGKDAKGDARVLAEAARKLPVDLAVATTTPLIIDEGVNYRARANLIRALLGRPEVKVYERMREEALRTRFDEELSRAIAWAAVNNPHFATDGVLYAHAMSTGDEKRADEIRRRFEARRIAAGQLVNAALNLDLETSNDIRAKSIRRTLNAHRLKFNRRR